MDSTKAFWRCESCGYEGDNALIVPATWNGEVVDIIDVMCPAKNCFSGKIKLVGTKEQVNEWWDAYYKRFNEVVVPDLSVGGTEPGVHVQPGKEDDSEVPVPKVLQG